MHANLTGGSVGELRSLLASWEDGQGLPSPFYVSPSVFSADLEIVFGRQWIFVATVAEIPEPGDLVTVDIGTYSVILVRDDEEQVQAFHNVCRHRGSRLVPEAQASVGNLVCPYHKWTYGLDGSLRYAASQPADFDASCFSLRKVAVRDVAGLIFISLAAEPPTDFASVAATVELYIAPHRLQQTKVAAQEDLVENGNWKLVMENNRECYHCDGHPELACSLFPTYGYDAETVPRLLKPAFDRYLRAEAELEDSCQKLGLPYAAIEQLHEREAGFRIQREALDGLGESFSPDGSALSSKLLGDFPHAKLGRLSLHHQPNAWFHILSDHAVTFSVLPMTPSTSLLRTTWLVHEDAVEGKDYDVKALTEVWRQTNAQDSHFVELTQKGVSSPAYIPGPFTPGEYQVNAFCRWYTDRLAESGRG
jgi:glycine betaine catabolism A